jgi:uncharacterized RDD family membrane protein YckC
MNSTILLPIVGMAVLAFQIGGAYLFAGAAEGGAWERNNGITTVSAASSPVALTWSVLGLSLFTLLMTTRQSAALAGVPAWWRRVVAFLIDFHFSAITLAGLSAIVPLAVEARRTGQFAWSYQRHYSAATDLAVDIPLVLLFMAALFLYFVIPLIKGRQTLGCFMMRTKIVLPFGNEGGFTWQTAVGRTWCEFKGVCSGTWFNPKRDANGNTWYDLESGCQVVLVDYTSAP